MKCAIMQPTYIPWAGYFNLISQVDYFVFLDDVQFQKGTWHNRNKLLADGVPTWITIPVIREFLGQKLCDSTIDDQKPWRRKHANMIIQNYQNHDFFSLIQILLEKIQDTSITKLTELNISLIMIICELLGLKPKFVRSSELEIPGVRSDRLVQICRQLNCDEYLSPPGAQDYLEQDNFTQLSEIKLIINNYQAHPYPQVKISEFISHLSIIDCMANLGAEKTAAYVNAKGEQHVS